MNDRVDGVRAQVWGAAALSGPEDLTYALLLSRAGVPVELRLMPGVPHEFDGIAYRSDAARRSVANRVRVLRTV